MSFFTIEQAPPRLNRSELAVPAASRSSLPRPLRQLPM